MSSTGRGRDRNPHDFYRTPAWCTRLIMTHPHSPLLGSHPGDRWLDPCAGDGAIIKAVGSLDPSISFDAVEIREEAWASLRALPNIARFNMGVDYLTRPHSGDPYDACVMNPPYSMAEAFVRKARDEAEIVCALLRVAWLSSQGRRDWLALDPPDVFIMPNRPSFTGKGTDSADYAWMCWPSQIVGAGSIHWLPSLSPRERKQWS
jgi:hypothetical protein